MKFVAVILFLICLFSAGNALTCSGIFTCSSCAGVTNPSNSSGYLYCAWSSGFCINTNTSTVASAVCTSCISIRNCTSCNAQLNPDNTGSSLYCKWDGIGNTCGTSSIMASAGTCSALCSSYTNCSSCAGKNDVYGFCQWSSGSCSTSLLPPVNNCPSTGFVAGGAVLVAFGSLGVLLCLPCVIILVMLYIVTIPVFFVSWPILSVLCFPCSIAIGCVISGSVLISVGKSAS